MPRELEEPLVTESLTYARPLAYQDTSLVHGRRRVFLWSGQNHERKPHFRRQWYPQETNFSSTWSM